MEIDYSSSLDSFFFSGSSSLTPFLNSWTAPPSPRMNSGIFLPPKKIMITMAMIRISVVPKLVGIVD